MTDDNILADRHNHDESMKIALRFKYQTICAISRKQEAFKKWVARELPVPFLAEIPEYVATYNAIVERYAFKPPILEEFMLSLKEYWAVHHWQFLVDSGLFEEMGRHLADTVKTHVSSIPLEGRCIMLRICSPKISKDCLWREVLRGSAHIVAAYIYRGGLNPRQISTEWAKDPEIKAVLIQARINKKVPHWKKVNSLACTFWRRGMSGVLTREVFSYFDPLIAMPSPRPPPKKIKCPSCPHSPLDLYGEFFE